MYNKYQKPQQRPTKKKDVAYEVSKGIWVGAICATIVFVLMLSYPKFFAGMLTINVDDTELRGQIAKLYDRAQADLKKFAGVKGDDYVPPKEVTRPLQYGECLVSDAHLEAGKTIRGCDIGTIQRFPPERLGSTSPLTYSVLIGKRAKMKIRPGDYLTTDNIDFFNSSGVPKLKVIDVKPTSAK